MESFDAGTTAGAGSFRCEACGFAMSLRERDSLPACPSCGGREFERASLFGEVTAQLPVLDTDTEAPEWLEEARETLSAEGDYLAFDDGDAIRVAALDDGWTRIGRSLSADVRIDDPTVSRRHALVHRDEDGVRMLDDRSLNGVFRNGERVELAELEDGDTLAVGRFELHFIRLAGDRAPAMIVGA